jgi:hypothetical protein
MINSLKVNVLIINPVWAETEAEILIKIANIPYSIGYYYDSVKINDGYGVKTLSIK